MAGHSAPGTWAGPAGRSGGSWGEGTGDGTEAEPSCSLPPLLSARAHFRSGDGSLFPGLRVNVILVKPIWKSIEKSSRGGTAPSGIGVLGPLQTRT